ncbi:zinc finger protein 569-like [Danaus plexippus]|uniref:Uncharacterized protein n=1 Tax=Danaus plexippus plexippus TaxID=278856 RepID=A0A212EJ35_DANPL|nr:zinc finger protein 569-like [Danaus plexippus]XP_032523497.1 zinc finger protein 569-like [Danaus plexippus plexippus]OWR41513.1 hypothetical protein KGM_215557 [Danaus plexippus plexippus]
MFDLKACVVCLKADVKLFSMNNGQLRQQFYLVAGLKTISGTGLPEYLCYQCKGYVRSFIRFREKCQRTFYVLQEILRTNNEITQSVLNELDYSILNIKPGLAYMDSMKGGHQYEDIKFKWLKQNRTCIEPQGTIPVMLCSTTENIFELPFKTKSNCDDGKNTYDMAVGLSNNVEKNEVELFDSNINISNNDLEVLELQKDDADGSILNEEYGNVIPISLKEAQAVVDINKKFALGKFRCDICDKAYCNEKNLELHKRMHVESVSGSHYCVLCKYYYKTEFLLKTHYKDKHMYKYLCRNCPEVSFDRFSAKRHFMLIHGPKGTKKDGVTDKLNKKNIDKKKQGIYVHKKIKPKDPEDFLIYTPIKQAEQYSMVLDRQKTKNYIESPYKCQYCFKGFREVVTYEKHMQKHDPVYSGKYQCDMCKIHCSSTRKMYKHMNTTHNFKFSCQMCSFVCYSRGQARSHYQWHKNVTYSCPHCTKVFTKQSTRLTHIRIKHPSTYICNICGHSYVSEAGLYCHKKIAHSAEEIKVQEMPTPSLSLYCSECEVQFTNQKAYDTHFGSSNKHADTNVSTKPSRSNKCSPSRPRGRPRSGSDVLNTGVTTASHCEICQQYLPNDVQAKRHYESEHPGATYLKRYMCDICGHTTKQYANLLVHMRTHTQEKPYSCPHCQRRFSMVSNRDRHLVVHTGEKRYQCQHCNRRFTQSSAVKLHIQTVHLKIPYAPWNKKNRKRRRDEPAPPSPTPPQPPQAPHKLVLDAGNYLSAYITYNE